MRYVTNIGDRSYTIDLNKDGEVVIDGNTHGLDLREIDRDGLFSLLLDSKSFEALIEEGDGEYRVLINGVLYHVQVADERARRLAEAAGAFSPTSGEVVLKSPMPGLIVSVPVSEGQAVKKGQVVIVLESMKMENELKASRDGTVSAIRVQPRQTVEQGQALVVLS